MFTLHMLGLIAGTGIASAIWTSIWTALVAWKTEHRRQKSQATYVALRAAIALEAYAIRCWQILYSGPEHYRQTGSPMAASVLELEGMPSDGDWKDVRPSLIDEALSFVDTVSIAKVIAEHARQFEGNPFEADTFAKERGRAAWAIAENLRTEYDLATRDGDKKRLKELFD